MIADMLNKKKLSLIVNELFIRGRKISLVFIRQYYFSALKNNILAALFYLKNSQLMRTSTNCI